MRYAEQPRAAKRQAAASPERDSPAAAHGAAYLRLHGEDAVRSYDRQWQVASHALLYLHVGPSPRGEIPVPALVCALRL
jgi:hypothetical protein